MVVMTSNLGAAEAAGRSGGLGFAPASDTGDRVTARLREYFSPELLGRIDKVAVFHPLDRTAMTEIAAHLLDETVQRAAKTGVTLTVAENAAPALAALAHRDAAGARALRRLVRSRVEEPLADLVLLGDCGPRLVAADGAGELGLRAL
jgi:ATP-dependent Clp protease ATP-binding subunit ClpA